MKRISGSGTIVQDFELHPEMSKAVGYITIFFCISIIILDRSQ